MKNPVTRRQFLETGSIVAGAAAVGAALSGCGTNNAAMASGAGQSPDAKVSRRKVAANEKFNIALVGCGGMGSYKLSNFVASKQVNLVAVCDVDDSQMADDHFMGVAKVVAGAEEPMKEALAKKPERIKDYRKVMDRKDIDLVIVATPDHWHAAPMMLAVASGKDVYCEKPCCHNIREGRRMVDAAKKYGAVVQVGTHQRQIPHIQEAREFIRAGKLGAISMTNTYTYGNDTPNGMGGDPDGPVPAGVDYDMWLGAAKVLPFNKRRFHNTWRWFFDYGCGMVGDWNVHLQDIIMWTMGATSPLSVSCVGGHMLIEDDRTTPDVMQAVYEFATPEGAPTSKKGFVQTYTMRKVSGKPWSAGGYGMDFCGTNGMIHLTRNDYNTDPDKWDWNFWDAKKNQGKVGENGSEWRLGNMTKEQKNRNFPGADQLAHQKHVENFFECVQRSASRRWPRSSRTTIRWPPATWRTYRCSSAAGSTGTARPNSATWTAITRRLDQEANKYLGREYRKGFELPNV